MSSRHLTIATAGHIDHGKTALVRALTGMETDRLQEEKRRGITIELGFAFLGDHITIIDVPGHERFIKTMVAGVSTVDLALLIVAANEGVMPQTREHLAILHLLGIPRLFVVLTKVGGKEPDWLGLVEEEVKGILPAAYKTGARFFRCDSISGEGIELLRQALLELAGVGAQHVEDPLVAAPLPPGQSNSGVFRLPVDRAFSLKGFGTVVTGTILGGQVRVGDQLVAMPQGISVRVRGLQSHARPADALGVGQRAALNLISGDVQRIQRGDWICAPDALLPTQILDISLQVLPESPPLKNRDRIRLHIGTAEILGRILLLGQEMIQPGEEGFAQIILEAPVVATRGDRFIIRRYSPLLMMGGGVILDPLPPRRRHSDRQVCAFLADLKDASNEDALLQKVRESSHQGLSARAAQTFLNVTSKTLGEMTQDLVKRGLLIYLGTLPEGRIISSESLNEIKRRSLQRIEAHHRQYPEQPGFPQAHLLSELSSDFPSELIEYALAELSGAELAQEKGCLRLMTHRIVLDEELAELSAKIERLLDASELIPMTSEAIEKQLRVGEGKIDYAIGVMAHQGHIVRTGDGFIWSVKEIQAVWSIVHGELVDRQGKTTSQLREALGIPRRYAVALLEYFDSLGKTLRQEDVRLPGPKFDPA